MSDTGRIQVGQSATATQEVLDRVAIRELVDRYFVGIDEGDAEMYRSCWARDAVFEMTDRGSLWMSHVGIDRIMELFGSRYSGDPNRRFTSQFGSSRTIIKINGDTATGETFAIGHVIDGPVENGRMMVRGLRYLDEFVRLPEGWRIQRRRHMPLWQYDVATLPAGKLPLSSKERLDSGGGS